MRTLPPWKDTGALMERSPWVIFPSAATSGARKLWLPPVTVRAVPSLGTSIKAAPSSPLNCAWRLPPRSCILQFSTTVP